MSKTKKIIFIVVSILIAIGAAIGIYFAVREKNAYTKEQQKFIDEIINSNKPNNPPVDIGGGTLPGGVVGEDETGNVVIVDGGESANEIWQKDPTDPNGGYDKVETPTEDDKGQPFTYQTVVQVSGNFALVQNDVGNHAVINLAETKVVLNYTDLQDAGNVRITGDVLFFTTPYYMEEVVFDGGLDAYTVCFLPLNEAKINDTLNYLQTDVAEDCVYSLQWLSKDVIAVQGIQNYQILRLTNGSLQVVYEKLHQEFLSYVKDAEEDDESNGNLSKYILLGGKLYESSFFISTTALNDTWFFVEQTQHLEKYDASQTCYYKKTASFEGYAVSQYFLLNKSGEMKNWKSQNAVWVPQSYFLNNYYVLLKCPIVDDAVVYKTIDSQNATFVYYNDQFQEILSMNVNKGMIVDFDEENNVFVVQNDGYCLVDANGKEISLAKDAIIYRYQNGCNLLGLVSTKENATSYCAVYTKNGKPVTGFEYTYLYGPFNNKFIGEKILLEYNDVMDSYDQRVVYEVIGNNGVEKQLTQNDMVVKDLLSLGYYTYKTNEDAYTIASFDGKVFAQGVNHISLALTTNAYILSYSVGETYYSYKLGIASSAEGQLLSFSTALSYTAETRSDLSLSTWKTNRFTINKPSVVVGNRTLVLYRTSEITKDSGSSTTASCDQFKINIPKIEREIMYYYGQDSADLIVKEGFFIEGYARALKEYPEHNIFGEQIALSYNSDEYFRLTNYLDVEASKNSILIGESITGKKIFKYVFVWCCYETSFNTITFDADGGTGASEDITLKHGDKGVTVSTPTKKGYRFLGYAVKGSTTNFLFDEKGVLVVDEKAGYKVTNEGEIALVAQWEPLVTTVNFMKKVGDGYEFSFARTFTFASEVNALTDEAPTQIGYTFTGWYLEPQQDEVKGTILFDQNQNPCVVPEYITLSDGKYIWDYEYTDQYDYDETPETNQEAHIITLYPYYEQKTMSVEVRVVAGKDVVLETLQYALFDKAFNKNTSGTYLYNEEGLKNRIQIQMSEALGYYISKFEIAWTTFNTSNVLNVSLNGESNLYDGIDATNGINKNVIEKSISGQTVAIIPNKTVSGNTATYSFDFKNGTGTDAVYLNTWSIVLTVYVEIDLSVSPKHLVQTRAMVATQMPVLLPQNKKEEA